MKQNVDSMVISLAVSAAVGLFVIGVVLWQSKKKKNMANNTIPSKWIKVGEISELIFYPLKGAKRKCVTEAEATARGLKELGKPDEISLQDRVFILTNEKKEFISTKNNSKLLFISTSSVNKNSVKFSFPDAEDLVVEIPDENHLLTQFSFEGDNMDTVDCGDKAATWFSQRLLGKSTGLRLGCFIQSLIKLRTLDGRETKKIAQAYTKLCPEYTGAYADIASYMLMSEESVKDLNSRLESPINEHHFRPNIMVKGCPAYSEDTWDWMKIGDSVILRGFKYCTRCVVTSIDPETATRNPSFEPIKTLRT